MGIKTKFTAINEKLADFKTAQANVKLKSKAPTVSSSWKAKAVGAISAAVTITGIVMAAGGFSPGGVGMGYGLVSSQESYEDYKKCLDKLYPQFTLYRVLDRCYSEQKQALQLSDYDLQCDPVPSMKSCLP